ncbi:sugar phosphate isomerase/epimerase [Mesorhizobium sp. GR13]|uniref:sugar phosphate isomerase/epimerase family protein n=1 Tax=Mesorhizobium sp. GR13 TaxID=2562308 RepID=UPI0010C0026E|nr:sugar phosphate isomerase/epimerase [Mesorhizobium sp. GR13]
MQVGIFAKTFPEMGAEQSLRAVADAGYEVAQFNLACLGLPSMPDALDENIAAQVGQAAKRIGVGIAAVSATYNMIHPDVAVRKKGMQRLEVIMQRCAAMGTSMVSLCTGTRDAEDQWRWHPDNASESAWFDLRKEMDSAVVLADRYDVVLGVEPELANVVSDAQSARRLLDEVGSARIKIIVDPANLFERADRDERRKIIEQAVDLLAPEIAMAHAKDRDTQGGFVAAGKGVVEFDHFLTRLKRANFNGPLVTHGLDASDAAAVGSFLRKTLSKVEQS